MTKTMIAVAAMAIGVCGYAAEVTAAQEKVAANAPRQMKLIIASFGTINSQAEVEGWLGDQLKPTQNTAEMPKLSEGDKILDPTGAAYYMRANWHDRRMEYVRISAEVQKENARRMKILTNLKTAMLSTDSQRYTSIARDYLVSKLQKESKGLVKVVDRGNMTIQQSEKALVGKGPDVNIDYEPCILSVVMGDREEDSKTIPLDNVGTTIKRTTYTQPYVGKVRDMEGNVVLAFDGTATWKSSKDNVVSSKESDPARKLVEAACKEIAEAVTKYFTVELEFKVKAPKGMDADDVEITVDGKSVNDDSVRVLAMEHVVKAELEGCKTIKKIVSVQAGDDEVKVKLNLKKAEAAAAEEE